MENIEDNAPIDFLPTKDFFDFDLYNIPDGADMGLAESGLLWSVLTLPMQESERDMLQKMLAAVGVESLNSAVVREAGAGELVSLSNDWQALPSVHYWLIFGRSARSVGWLFDAPMYQVLRIGGRVIIFGDALAVLQSDMGKKKLLWAALQQIEKPK
jgi:hypothetical protein